MHAKNARRQKRGAAHHPAPAQQKTNGQRPRGINAEAAQVAANEYCLLHYGTSYAGGVPQRLSLPTTEVWVVPVVFTSPGYGVVGQAGMTAVDARTASVIAGTPPEEVRQAGKRLAQENRHDLDAAFSRARKV